MRRLSMGELVCDFTMYPRASVDGQHVHYMVAALEAGATLPPMIIDKKSRRIVDGFHRYRAYRRTEVEEVDVIEKTYKDDKALFLDAVRFNAGHGRSLTTFDRTHCIIRANELRVDEELLAGALCITMDALGELRTGNTGRLRAVGGGGQSVPLKRTIRHMAGRTLSKAQGEANDKLSGMEQAFYVNQIITLIETNLLDRDNEQLMARLRVLEGLLAAEIAATAA